MSKTSPFPYSSSSFKSSFKMWHYISVKLLLCFQNAPNLKWIWVMILSRRYLHSSLTVPAFHLTVDLMPPKMCRICQNILWYHILKVNWCAKYVRYSQETQIVLGLNVITSLFVKSFPRWNTKSPSYYLDQWQFTGNPVSLMVSWHQSRTLPSTVSGRTQTINQDPGPSCHWPDLWCHKQTVTGRN